MVGRSGARAAVVTSLAVLGSCVSAPPQAALATHPMRMAQSVSIEADPCRIQSLPEHIARDDIDLLRLRSVVGLEIGGVEVRSAKVVVVARLSGDAQRTVGNPGRCA